MAGDLPLTERYLRYKHGTEKITSWLAATASKCCDISHLVAALSTKSAHKTAAQGGTVEILAAELVSLSVAIIERTPPVAIPAKILTALTKTIEGRQAVADIYKRRAEKNDREATGKDSGHQHFIGILIEVKRNLDKAACTFESRAEQCESATHHHNDTNIVEDRIAAFEPELHGTRGLEDDTSNDSSPSRRASLSKATFVLKKQDHEVRLVCLCFLDSLKEVRWSVINTWKEYMRGDATFVAASMTTHAAICILRCAEEEFTASYPEFDTWHMISGFFGLDFANNTTQPVKAMRNDDAEGPLSEFADLDIVDLFAATGYEVATIFHERAQWVTRNQSRLRDGQPRVGIPKIKCSIRRKLTQHPFVKMLLDNIFLGWTKDDAVYGRRKEFYGALLSSVASGKLSTWTVVACQMYVDVFDVLGRRAGDGVPVFRRSLRDIETQAVALTVYLKQHPDASSALKVAAEHFEYSATDAKEAGQCLGIDTSSVRRGDVLSPQHSEQRRVICKMMRNRFLASLGHLLHIEIGCSAFDVKMDQAITALSCTYPAEKYIQTIAFVYTACRSLDLLPVWPDMEFLIGSQPKMKSWSADSDPMPKALFESFRAFLGMPRSSSIDRSFRLGTPMCLLETEKLEFGAKLPMAFTRFVTEPGPLPLNKRLQVLLHQLTAQKRTEGAPVNAESGWGAETSFQPVQLLSTFKEQFKSDEPLLNFNYFRFWAECGTLCDKLWEEVISVSLPKDIPLLGPATMVSHCLLLDYECLLTRPAKISATALADAAKVLEAHIKPKGDRYSRAAYEQSSGHIPENAKPSGLDTELLTEQQKHTVQRLRKAGTSVSTTGGLLFVYHTKLISDDFFKACAERKSAKSISIPAYMYDGEEELPSW